MERRRKEKSPERVDERPYIMDEGRTLNGPVEIVTVAGGMMLLAVGAGHHDVSFVYSAPGFKTGSLVSLIALGLLLGYVPLEMRRRKKTGPETSLA